MLGTLESVDARAAVERIPTGRVVGMREESVLERVGDVDGAITEDQFGIVRP